MERFKQLARATQAITGLRKATKAEESDAERELEVTLDLDGNKLRFGKRWQLGANVAALAPAALTPGSAETSAATEIQNSLEVLQREVQQLRDEKAALKRRLNQAVEEKLLAEYKNQVLLEMVRSPRHKRRGWITPSFLARAARGDAARCGEGGRGVQAGAPQGGGAQVGALQDDHRPRGDRRHRIGVQEGAYATGSA